MVVTQTRGGHGGDIVNILLLNVLFSVPTATYGQCSVLNQNANRTWFSYVFSFKKIMHFSGLEKLRRVPLVRSVAVVLHLKNVLFPA